jgi:HB1, ASXL, restriction endonuclease HTH domain
MGKKHLCAHDLLARVCACVCARVLSWPPLPLCSAGDIAKVALRMGLLNCAGKTPEATMASALYTDVKRKEGLSIFIRPHEGLFGLREWSVGGGLDPTVRAAPLQCFP